MTNTIYIRYFIIDILGFSGFCTRNYSLLLQFDNFGSLHVRWLTIVIKIFALTSYDVLKLPREYRSVVLNALLKYLKYFQRWQCILQYFLCFYLKHQEYIYYPSVLKGMLVLVWRSEKEWSEKTKLFVCVCCAANLLL